MFSPDRQGFFPALWVQFVQELGEGERRQFAALTNRLKRIRTIMMTMQELQRMDVLPQKFLASDYKENITKKALSVRIFYQPKSILFLSTAFSIQNMYALSQSILSLSLSSTGNNHSGRSKTSSIHLHPLLCEAPNFQRCVPFLNLNFR